MTTLREHLKEFYRDYRNNYLTTYRIAKDYDIPIPQMHQLLQVGRVLHDRDAEKEKQS